MVEHRTPIRSTSRQGESAKRSVETITAPSPSLPKGGGAIHGIGEKFSVNPVTGTGTLTVPLATTPGRSGFHPELSLSYDSGAGNGPFGLGWHLSVPMISRKTEKGLPRYRDADEPDTFLLSGAEDLVPALIETEAGWGPDVDETTELRIERYRPRIEALFARIERRTRKADGDVHWVAITRDNVKSIYGGNSNSRVADPEDPLRIFSWLLARTEDGRGNVIVYEYKRENLANVTPTLPEERRLRGEAPITNCYLKRIRYGNTKPGDAYTSVFEVVFDYGEHDPTTPTVDDMPPWPSRQDPFSSYRAGFEVRTYRLCRRVLMFHRFPELGTEPCLVRSTDFAYVESPTLTRLASVTQVGYLRQPGSNTYSRKQLPPLEFEYSLPAIQSTIQGLDPESVTDLPAGVDGHSWQWADLDGEGIPGVLSDHGGALYYKRNLGAGRLAPAQRLPTQSSTTALASGNQQIMDLGGDGRHALVQLKRPMAGYFERMPDDDGWAPFLPFVSQPNIDWNDPNLRFIDLNGDGIADVLVARDDVFVWYPSQGRKGFGPPQTFRRFSDEDKGPALVFADATHTVFLADMSGDGLMDLARITNGEVCYWPNLGHGRFGPKVTMASAPIFDHPEAFDPSRIRLGDIDGSGTTDIFYISRDGVRFWFNHAGNSWGEEQRLAAFPSADPLSTVAVVDLLGTGTACLVWSSKLPNLSQPAVRYVDLLGSRKPHLLTTVRNNMGLETRVAYAPSTRFYLEDCAAGRPWVTRLPFPVHVLERVETWDAVRRVRLVSIYVYHHGYYDGDEREFRGFGLIEQRDTESFASAHGKGLFPDVPLLNGEHVQPPVLTKTWFHTGAWGDGDVISRQFEREYYASDAQAVLLPDTSLPGDLTIQEAKEACRALKGQILRQEVYALDGSKDEPHPYMVSEGDYTIVRVQPLQKNRYAVFFAHPRERIDYRYERNPHDPRIGHSFTLAVDPWGNVVQSATVGYSRRSPKSDDDRQPHDEAQKNLLITLSESEFANLTAVVDGYRIGIPLERRSYELTFGQETSEPLTFERMLKAASDAKPLAYEDTPTAGKIEKRLIEHTRTRYYDSTRLPSPLPFGQADVLALPYESYGLAFSPKLLAVLYEGRVTDAILTEGGYVQLGGEPSWWVPSGRAIPGKSGDGGFDVEPFYISIEYVDPFGNITSVAYDDYLLLVKETRSPLGTVVVVENDYRIMGQAQVTDPNGNRSAARFDELGTVVATAVMGKLDSAEGDKLDAPTAIFEYDLFAWKDTGRPNVVRSRARETHGTEQTRWQESYSYSDGAGHEILKKVQAAPGQAPLRDAAGKLLKDAQGALALGEISKRWVGTGRTVLNNKGDPIKQYEPFFSATHEYEDEDDLVLWGVTPLLHYDPLGRLVRTDQPDGTCSRVRFTPWEQENWDPNDTVLEPGNGWYAARRPSASPAQPAAEQRAAKLAAAHAGTPAVAVLDPLGRAVVAVADLGGGKTLATRTTLDVDGNPLVIQDPRRIEAMVHAFDVLGRKCWQKSVDAGERWTLSDVLDKPLRTWDSRGHVVRTTYDALHRPTGLWVQAEGGPEVLAERTVYGEEHPSPGTLNLRGRVYQQYDDAGLVTYDAYDFKGNLLSMTRYLLLDAQGQLDWSAEPEIEDEAFTTKTTYDAMNRVTSQITPDVSLVRTGYNEAGLLERVDVWLRGIWARNTSVEELVDPSMSPVLSIDYNAKGHREKIVHGNGTVTTYGYDTFTFRLARLRTTRKNGTGALLQNLQYTYDPAGNIVEIADRAQKTIYRNDDMAEPIARYEYDPIYRVTRATGREHAGQNADIQLDENGFPLVNSPHPNDPQALRSYVEYYAYDDGDNILEMRHEVAAGSGGWTRRYEIDQRSNRLLSTSFPGEQAVLSFSAKYGYDAHGNMTSMPHLPRIGWNSKDQLREVDLGGGGLARYTYDACGQRVRKLWEHSGVVEERIYIGGYEIYRRRQGGVVVFERDTLHVMDGDRLVALVETKTVDSKTTAFINLSRVRYQLGNHLGSIAMEVDDAGLVISYEEFHLYGTTAYRAATEDVRLEAKRYRYTGKERDEETGLYYHGARHYAPWLGRWTSADPAGTVDGPNLYAYARAKPASVKDPSGHFGEEFVKGAKAAIASIPERASAAATQVALFARDVAITAFNEFSRGMALNKAAHNGEQADVAAALGAESVRKYRQDMADRLQRDADATPPPLDTKGGKVGQALALTLPLLATGVAMATIGRGARGHAERRDEPPNSPATRGPYTAPPGKFGDLLLIARARLNGVTLKSINIDGNRQFLYVPKHSAIRHDPSNRPDYPEYINIPGGGHVRNPNMYLEPFRRLRSAGFDYIDLGSAKQQVFLRAYENERSYARQHGDRQHWADVDRYGLTYHLDLSHPRIDREKFYALDRHRIMAADMLQVPIVVNVGISLRGINFF